MSIYLYYIDRENYPHSDIYLKVYTDTYINVYCEVCKTTAHLYMIYKYIFIIYILHIDTPLHEINFILLFKNIQHNIREFTEGI